MSIFGRITAWSDARESRKARRALLTSPDRYRVNRHRRAARSLEASQESNLFSGWGTSPVSINRTIFQSLTGTRARSRDRALNDPYAVRFTSLVKHNVVGPAGPRLSSQVRTAKAKPDRELREIVERGWNDFANSKEFDVSHRLTFKQFCSCVMNDVVVDGEALVRIWRSPAAGKWGIAFQMLDAEHLDVRMNADLGDGWRIVMGVELDPFDRPVAYWFKSSLVDEIVPRRMGAPRHTRIAVEDILHVFLSNKGTQIRGIPWFAPVVTSLKMLHGYHQDAEKAARFGANASLFIKSPSGEETVAGAMVRSDGDLEIEFSDDLIGHQLSEGQELVDFDPRYPHEQFADFTKAMLRRAASGLNVPYPSFGSDLEGVNFSSIRAGELEVREMWKTIQEFLFSDFAAPCFRAWLELALIRRQLRTARGTALTMDLEDRLRVHSWQGKRWSWVDPLKDATANKMLNELNALSVSEIIESMGGDPEETRERIAAERIEMQRLGIVVSASPATTPAVAVDPDPDDVENGDGDAQ